LDGKFNFVLLLPARRDDDLAEPFEWSRAVIPGHGLTPSGRRDIMVAEEKPIISGDHGA